MTQKKKLSRAEEKILVQEMVQKCKARAAALIKQWTPTNKSWPTKKGAAYIRLSTEDQCLVDGGSLEQQVNIIFDEVASRSNDDEINYKIVGVFVDAGISGQTDNRPALKSLQYKIERGDFAFIGMKEVARLFREALLLALFLEVCNKSGCEVMFKGLPINPNDPNDVFKLRMFGAMAEYEAKNTSKRVRENVYSALVNNGKFNSTKKVLGLDQLVVDGVPKVGLYQANKEELKVVIWIFKTFIRVASYQITLDELCKRGIKNKNGKDFKKNSLRNLITNQKLIGKWELNPENKGKPAKKLMPYEHYKVVDLPHGCVVNLDLWNQAQSVVNRIKKSKARNTKINRPYPLSGLLTYVDGTTFGGSRNHGRTTVVHYYMNTIHRFRLSADAVEAEARKTVANIIKQTPKLQMAIVERTKTIRSSIDLLQQQVGIINAKIAKAKADRIKLDKRLDFLLSIDDEQQAEEFRQEYMDAVSRLNLEMEEAQKQKAAIECSRVDLEEDELNTATLIAKAEKVQELMQKKDPAGLKNAYRTLFSEIVVGEVDRNGRRKLEFKIRGSGDFDSPVNRRNKCGIGERMAQVEGLEPPTR